MSETPAEILEEIERARVAKGSSIDLPSSVGVLEDLPEELFALEQLESLVLYGQPIEALPTDFFRRLPQLRELDIAGLPLNRLPEGGECTLTIDSRQWLEVDGVRARRIKFLEVRSEHAGQLEGICSMPGLSDLTTLQLAECGLDSLPDSLDNLSRLNTLYLYGNVLDRLPEVVTRLESLRVLYINNNRLQELPETILRLSNLLGLYISGNPLATLPESLGQMGRLKALNLRNTQFSTLPSCLETLSQDAGIDITSPRLSDVEQAVAAGGTAAIQAYLRQRREGQLLPLHEAKLIIVGEPGAGKTTLMKKLLDPAYPVPNEAEKSTQGINVHAGWRFPYPRDPSAAFTANIWDFGGQEIQYATHQFFLSENALYVLLSDDRRQETDYGYWFKVIELLGGRSPVLVFLHEKRGAPVTDFDLGSHKGDHPELPITVRDADLGNRKDGRGERLRGEVQRLLADLPHVGEQLPASWDAVRRAAGAQKGRRHLCMEAFAALCAEHGVKGRASVETVARYLNRLGVIVYFEQDEALKDFIITDPQWAVDALYTVLDKEEVQKRGGRLERGFFRDTLLEKGGYDEEEIGHLLTLLTRDKFELCYPLEGAAETYMVPLLLPVVQPAYAWDEGENLRLEYRYPFMPKGLLARFTVRLHEHIAEEAGRQLVWRRGVVLAHNGARAEISEIEDSRNGAKGIRIRVRGELSRRRHLLSIIRHEIDQTHRRSFPNLRASEQVPCDCGYCAGGDDPNLYPYERLERHIGNGQSTIYCDFGNEQVPIARLLNGVVDEGALRAAAEAEVIDEPRGMLGMSFRHQQLMAERDRLYALLQRAISTAATTEVTVNQRSEQSTRVSVEVSVEVKGALKGFRGTLDLLEEEAEDEGLAAELDTLKRDLERLRAAVVDASGAKEPDEVAPKSLARLKRFAAGVETGGGLLGRAAGAGGRWPRRRRRARRRAGGSLQQVRPLAGAAAGAQSVQKGVIATPRGTVDLPRGVSENT